MPIQRKEKLEGILIKDFDSGVQKRYSEEFAIRTVSQRQHIVRHFEGAGMH